METVTKQDQYHVMNMLGKIGDKWCTDTANTVALLLAQGMTCLEVVRYIEYK